MNAVLAALPGSSTVTVHWVVFLMIVAGVGVMVLVWARRLWIVELIFTAVFFILVGATSFGQAIYHAIDSIGQK
jgi:hypothetical protein